MLFLVTYHLLNDPNHLLIHTSHQNLYQACMRLSRCPSWGSLLQESHHLPACYNCCVKLCPCYFKWIECNHVVLFAHTVTRVKSATLENGKFYGKCKQGLITCCAFCMPQVPFAFLFESEQLNGNSATKQSPNYHSSDLGKSVKWPNGNSVTVLSPNCHLAIWLTLSKSDEW